MPYLRYVATLDARTRPEHMRWHGTVLPVDHPWWETHAPPNGWYCRCIIQQLSEEDLDEFGYQVSTEPPPGSARTRAWTNKRTGETVQVPVGIDPGFDHNVGTVRPVAQSVKTLKGKVAAAPAPIAAAAKKPDLAHYITEGRVIRDEIVQAAGGDPNAPGFSGRMRALVTERLRRERGAGTVDPDLEAASQSPGDLAATERVRDAAGLFPASWVTAANTGRLRVASNGQQFGGSWRPPQPGQLALAKVSADPGNAIHEYVHHLQHAMPGLDKWFRELHDRRTAGEPVIHLKPYQPNVRGRRDQYIDAYFGREYPQFGHRPIEVITVGHQILLHSRHSQEVLWLMVRDDPEMADLLLGALVYYNP